MILAMLIIFLPSAFILRAVFDEVKGTIWKRMEVVLT